MTKELLQQALDALYSEDVDQQSWAKTALMKAIAQPEQPDVSDVTAHPLQPVVTDKLGTLRFKANAIVRFLSEGRLNELATMDFSAKDRMQLAQLIGYSVSGYGTLSYVTDESYEAASRALPATQGAPAQSAAQPVQTSRAGEPTRCPEKLKPGGCQLHNLHCGWPKCNEAAQPIQSAQRKDADLLEDIARGLDRIANAKWQNWQELANPYEFERWVKARANHAAIQIRAAITAPKAIP